MKRFFCIIAVGLIASQAAAERFWLGPVAVFPAASGLPAYYGPPTGVTSWIDLRTPSECGVAPTAANGVAIFVTDDATNLGGSYTNLGTDSERVLTNPQAAALGTALRMPNAPAANKLADIIAEALTVQADPTGAARAKPIMPEYDPVAGDVRLKLWLGGRVLRQQQFNPNNAVGAVIQQQLQAEYRAARQAVQQGQLPPNFHRKILGYWVRKYRQAYRWFEPNDLPDESDLTPSTTITENFNKADGALGPTLTWSNVHGGTVFTVASNAAAHTGGTYGMDRAQTDLSSADHYAQATISTVAVGSQSVGVACRKDSTSTISYYFAYQRQSTTWATGKWVAGAFTAAIGSSTSAAASAGDVIKLQCSGSTISRYRNGVLQDAVTDSSVSGNLRCGIASADGAGGALDDFQAADLSAGAPESIFPKVIIQ